MKIFLISLVSFKILTNEGTHFSYS